MKKRFQNIAISILLILMLFPVANFSQSFSYAMDEKVVKIYYENPKVISECIQADFNIIAIYPTYILSNITSEQESFLKERSLYYVFEEDMSKIYMNGYHFISLEDKSIHWVQSNSVPDPNSLSSFPSELYFIQLIGPEKEEWLSTLKNLTVDLIMPLHKNAWLVRMDASIYKEIVPLSFVKGLDKVPVGAKIYPDLLKYPENEKMDIEIKGSLDLDIQELYKTFTNQNIYYFYKTEVFSYTVIKHFDKKDMVSLAENKCVYQVTQYFENEPLNDRASRVVRINQLNPATNHNENIIQGLDGTGEIIGIADTGIVDDHPDFWDPTFNDKVIATFPTSNWLDSSGHGSHVAGTIAGTGAMSTNNKFQGMAPKAKLVIQRTSDLDYGVYDPYEPLWSYALFEEAYNAGARTHNNSWGYNYQHSHLLGAYLGTSRYIDDFLWDHLDCTVVKSAGNDRIFGLGWYQLDYLNYDPYSDYFPNGTHTIKDGSTAKNIICVGATENETGTLSAWPSRWWRDQCDANRIAIYSSIGPTHDGRIKPDVVAPGDGIYSVNHHDLLDYTHMSGTSMAAPVVTGSSALIRQYYRTREAIPEQNISSALIKATLINGAGQGFHDSDGNYFINPLLGIYPDSLFPIPVHVTMPNQNSPLPISPNYFTGFGRINLKDSLYPKGKNVLYINAYDSINKDKGLWNGGRHDTYYFKVNNPNTPIKATLVWTDYADEFVPPNAGPRDSAKDLINDLNLEIFNYQSQNYYRGNQYVEAYSEVNPDQYDHINNVEQINILQDDAGYYRLSVNTLENVRSDFEHGDRQPYAVILSGGDITWVNPSEVPFEDLSVKKMNFSTKTLCEGNQLKWTKPSVLFQQVAYYIIHRIQFGCGSYGAEGILTINDQSNNLEFLDTSAQYNCMYGYFIEAFNAKHDSIAITPMLESGFIVPPAPPSPYKPIVNSDQVHLYWNNPSQGTCPITYYIVYRSEDPDTLGEQVAILLSNQKSYFDKEVEPGKTYYYHLISIDSRGLRSLYSKKIVAIIPTPDYILDLSVEISKHELCAGEEFSVKVTVYNQTPAIAKEVTLIALPNYDIQYIKADKLIAVLNQDRSAKFLIPSIPSYSQYSFTTIFVVNTSVVQEKLSSILFTLDQNNETVVQKEIRSTLKKCNKSNEPISVSVKMLNLAYDPETGEYYLPSTSTLDMTLKLSGVTFPYFIKIQWGDGEKDIYKPDKTEHLLHHLYETKGKMTILIEIEDASGKTKAVDCSVTVK